MSRFHSYLNSARLVLDEYNGEQPFSSFLKTFFSQQKKFGSSDRRIISHLCYCYFRLGHSLKSMPFEERILVAVLVCSTKPDPYLGFQKPEWNEQVHLPVLEKIKITGIELDYEEVFPWETELSDAIEFNPFSISHLIQPSLFLRCRPDYEEKVKEKLTAAAISFVEVIPGCLELAPQIKIEEIIEVNKEAVIQDYSSQSVGELLKSYKLKTISDKQFLWDCCAASGGKSILANDVLGNIDLTVTDIRKSILLNLDKRFAAAGIKQYRSLWADLTKPVPGLKKNYFDLVIADVPCTGSGTWSRTPEQLYFFKKEKTEEFAFLQQAIINNVIPHIKPDGFLLYITCSVFKKENEEAVEKICERHSMKVIETKWFKGYDKRADTLFGALLRKE